MSKQNEPCGAEGCERLIHAGKYCAKHYARWVKFGSTELAERAPCIVVGCDTVRSAGGVMCPLHRNRHLHSGDPHHSEPPCSIAGCGKEAYSRSWCTTHYNRWCRHGDPLLATSPLPAPRRRTLRPDTCTVDGCSREHYAINLCVMHYARWRAHGDPTKILVAPYGGGSSKDGYRLISVAGKSVLEHRHLMSERLGRPLLRHETVHHINGDRSDNRPENLQLWNTRQPKGQRVQDKVAWAVEILELYAPEALSRSPFQLKL